MFLVEDGIAYFRSLVRVGRDCNSFAWTILFPISSRPSSPLVGTVTCPTACLQKDGLCSGIKPSWLSCSGETVT